MTAEFRLRECRRRAGMSQAFLARLCGTDQTWIAHVENGQRHPNWENATNIAIALGCSLDELAGIEPPEQDAARLGERE